MSLTLDVAAKVKSMDFDIICNALGLQTTAAKECLRVSLENALLVDKKHQDYGPHNISMHGELGIIVRLSDKVARLSNLFSKRAKKPRNESVEDTWRDIANYATIAMVYRRGLWS